MNPAWLAELKQRLPASARLVADSRQVRPGDVFLAFPGATHDGRHYIAAAVAAGAAAVLWEPHGAVAAADLPLEHRPVPDLRRQAAALANAWWETPSRHLWMIGITGTNGKTSVSHWLGQALDALGRRAAIIGTLGNGPVGALAGSSHTTPDAVTLHGLLAHYRAAGVDAVAMEVSSHALDQDRVEGVHFDVAVLTNLSRDHLDYHGDMASYAQAKARLFGWPGLAYAVLNLDDAFGRSLAANLAGGPTRVLGYGLDRGELRGRLRRLDDRGLTLAVECDWGRAEIDSPLIGRFNASNLLACLGALLVSGIGLDAAIAALAEVRPVAGRMQRLGGVGGPGVIIDYAHTPDALEQVLRTLRPLTPGRLLCVFGCGGGRDRGKRPLMGEVAAALADRVIVTSDNPRHEDPAEIAADILAGMPPGQTVILEREAAIQAAIAEAGAADMVLIAGKGHETHQEIAGERRPFSDVETAARALGQWQGARHATA